MQRLYFMGSCDYYGVLSGSTTAEMFLADFMISGDKERFANGQDIKCRHVQEDMISRLRTLGFDGWISTQDASDTRLELCIFPESIKWLAVEDFIVYGP